MERLKMHTPDIAQRNYEQLAALFPNAVTETINETGEIVRAIDADVLRQEISAAVVDGPQERYQFTWPDKKKSVVLANEPIAKTLRLDREKSVGRDGTLGKIDTENIYIEGDNLEALKLLRETYLGKVKMIYIDPPYNTGNDFIYKDNFSRDMADYLAESGQFDEEGNRLVPNLESNGRFHTDWLNMLYPRLRLAKDLLANDGLVFISIKDSEIENLIRICNEVFGDSNFVCNFVWNTEGHTDNQFQIKINHEYILAYAKRKSSVEIGWVIDPNTRKESNLWKGFAENSITKNGPKNPPLWITLEEGFPCMSQNAIISCNQPSKGFWKDLKALGYISRQMTDTYNVSYPIRKDDAVIKDGKLQNKVDIFSGWANSDKLKEFIRNGYHPIEEADGEISFYLSDRGVVYYKKNRTRARNIVSVLRNFGTTEQMKYELEDYDIYFSYPKPLDLIKYLLQIGNLQKDDIVLDFFSGSATTAHAVMQLNAEDIGYLKFIMVQYPEKTEEKTEAFKTGYMNICEIGEERIRRAGRKIKEATCADIDYGFRVFKIDSSNMKNIYYKPAELKQEQLALFSDNIKVDRTPEDLLFQVMLDLGILLSSKIEEKTIGGKKVFSVADGYLIACFDEKVTDETVTAIAKQQPYYAVFRDSGFDSDSVAANFDQIFETYSPKTQRKVL